MRLHVHLLPRSIREGELTGSTAVVIDVLRATTTMATALAHGAQAVVPCWEVASAVARAEELRAAGRSVLLGGERGGRLIPGFDLGNSPAEYTADRVAGRTIVFTTTNGTRAIEACRDAERIVLAALVNRRAVVEALRGAPRVDIVCAGTEGQITREDVLAAGAIVDALDANAREWNDEATVARAAWREVLARAGTQQPGAELLARELADGHGGRNVVALGLERDLRDAAALDHFDVVPVFDRASGEFRSSY